MIESNRMVLAWLALLGGFAALGVLLVSAVWSPEAMAEGIPLRLVGLRPEPCPGCSLCGMSRAFSGMTHGDLGRALDFHPGVLVLYPLFLGLALVGPLWSLRTLVPRRFTCAKRPWS